MYEDSQAALANSQDELANTEQQLTTTQAKLAEEQLLSGNLNSMVMMFAATTLVFAVVAAFLGFYMFSKRAKAVQTPV